MYGIRKILAVPFLILAGCASQPPKAVLDSTSQRVLVVVQETRGGYVASTGPTDRWSTLEGVKHQSVGAGGSLLTLLVNEAVDRANATIANAANDFDGFVKSRNYRQRIEEIVISRLTDTLKAKSVSTTVVSLPNRDVGISVDGRRQADGIGVKFVTTLSGTPPPGYDSVITLHMGYGFHQINFAYDFRPKIVVMLDLFDAKTLAHKGQIASFLYKQTPFVETSLKDSSCIDGASYGTFGKLVEGIDGAHASLLKCAAAVGEEIGRQLLTQRN